MKSFLNKGYSIDRPPMLNGSNYPYWKIGMKIFIQAHDYSLWKITVNGSHTPKVLKEHDKEIAQLNAKVMNILYYSLDLNEFNLISSCISAKSMKKIENDIWGSKWKKKKQALKKIRKLNPIYT